MLIPLLAAGWPSSAQEPSPRPPDRSAQRVEEDKRRQSAAFFADYDREIARIRGDLAGAKRSVCLKDAQLEALLDHLAEDRNALFALSARAYHTLPRATAAATDSTISTLLDQLLDEMVRLQALKCPPPPLDTDRKKKTPPPAPATPPPQPAPRTLTPTHRTARCASCQAAAKNLNDTADRYAEAVRRNDPAQVPLREDMAKLSKALDGCERVCRVIAKPRPSSPPILLPPPPRQLFKIPVCPPGQAPLGPDCVKTPTIAPTPR